jgi:hypothetical protein
MTDKRIKDWENAVSVAMSAPSSGMVVVDASTVLAIESALRAVPAIPEGWKLVPSVPTNEWIGNLAKQQSGSLEEVPFLEIHQCIAELLEASPQAPDHAEDVLGMVQAPQPACWCETCDLAQGNPMGRTRMSTCPQCGDKRCQRAKHHDNACSAQPAQPRKPLFEDLIAQHPGLREELSAMDAMNTADEPRRSAASDSI